MHPKDYALILFGAALVAVWLGLCGLKQKWSWWKDAFQVAGVVAGVAVIVGVVSPAKPVVPKSEAEIAREAQDQQQEQDQKALVDAMVACQYAIQARLRYPDSYSTIYLSNYNRQFTTAQGWEIFKAFEAKNGFGGSLPQVGHCSIRRGGGMTVEISDS